MGRQVEGSVLSADLLDVPELHDIRFKAIGVLEKALKLAPMGIEPSVEKNCPALLHAIGYAETDPSGPIIIKNMGATGVRDLVMADTIRSAEIYFSFLHYLGTSAVYRSFEQSTVMSTVIREEDLCTLKDSMLDARANLRARVYDATIHEFGRDKDSVKYAYIKQLATEALAQMVDPGQEISSEAIVNNCLSGILAEQKIFRALYLMGFSPRFATNEEESAQIDIVMPGIKLQVKGNSLEEKVEARFVIKNSATPKVVVSTSGIFPRFTLGVGQDVLGKMVNKLATVYN